MKHLLAPLLGLLVLVGCSVPVESTPPKDDPTDTSPDYCPAFTLASDTGQDWLELEFASPARLTAVSVDAGGASLPRPFQVLADGTPLGYSVTGWQDSFRFVLSDSRSTRVRIVGQSSTDGLTVACHKGS